MTGEVIDCTLKGAFKFPKSFVVRTANKTGVDYGADGKVAVKSFLQRVINGGGQIVREMALGSERLDLGVHFRGAVYAVEVKTTALYEKSHEKAYAQVVRYMDRLGVP